MNELLNMHKKALAARTIMRRVEELEDHLLEGHAHLLEKWDYSKNLEGVKQITKDYIALVREYVGYVRVSK